MVASSIASESFGILTSSRTLVCSSMSAMFAVLVGALIAPEGDPDRVHYLVTVAVEAVGNRRLERDRVSRLEHVLLEADGHTELAAENESELPPACRTSFPSELEAPPTS